MLWDILSNEEKARIILKILLHTSLADGELSKEEFSYLVHVANLFHIDPEELRNMYSDKSELNEILPRDEQDRMNILYHLLFMVDADKIIADKEISILHHFGFKLGFSESMINDFILTFKHYDIDDLSPNAMIDIIKKYKN